MTDDRSVLLRPTGLPPDVTAARGIRLEIDDALEVVRIVSLHADDVFPVDVHEFFHAVRELEGMQMVDDDERQGPTPEQLDELKAVLPKPHADLSD